MIRFFLLTVLLLATATQYACADAVEAVTVEEQPISTQSLRRGQSERRLSSFAWGNLLYALHVCHGNGNGWCPAPHCDGPLKPPACKHNSGSGGGSSSGVSSSSGGGNAQYVSSYVDGDSSSNGAAQYVSEENVETAYNYESDFSGNEVSTGVSNTSGSRGVQRRTNFLLYLVAGAAVASVIGIFLMKKKSSNSEEEDIEHQLSQSVSKRLEKLLAGKGVSPIHAETVGPAFVDMKKDGSTPKLADVLPKKQNLAEPDEEAIEINLDTRNLTNDYVKMA